MKVVNLKQAQGLSGQLRGWAYNALDCTGTREIADVLLPRLDAETEQTYGFERAVQAPAFAMLRRGVRVNVAKRDEAVNRLRKELRDLTKALNKDPLLTKVWDKLEKVTDACPKATRKDGKHKWPRGVEDTPAKLCEDCGASRFRIAPFNPNSSDQVKHLFYELLGVKPMRNKTGEISVDDEVLYRIKHKYKKYAELVDQIKEYRNLKKQISFLTARLSDDNRYHSSFNVGTAWTGRWSSSKDHFHRGGNLQNIAERHRHVFEADPGMEICYADLKQAESNVVAHLAGDEEYIEAHRSGDVHTYVTRLVWPDLGWEWDLKKDKPIAKQNPEWDQAPGHNFRFQSKRIQHGGNYGLSAYGISRIAKIPLKAAREAFYAYHGAFPFINGWQNTVARAVREQEPLVNPLGRKVRLFGRPWDDHTYKQGLSFLPQSAVADLINIAVWRVWKELEPEGLELLAQVHDALLFQVPKGRRDLIERAVALMTIPLPVKDYQGNVRMAEIETEAAVGRNWGHRSGDNPHGIEEIEL